MSQKAALLVEQLIYATVKSSVKSSVKSAQNWQPAELLSSSVFRVKSPERFYTCLLKSVKLPLLHLDFWQVFTNIASSTEYKPWSADKKVDFVLVYKPLKTHMDPSTGYGKCQVKG